MSLNVTVAVAVLPALGLLWLFKKWDEKRPEPDGAVRNVLLLGMVLCIPAVIIELLMERVMGPAIVEAQGQFVRAFVVASFTEESLKLALVLLYVWKKEHFNEVMDGILYTAAASLGFALLENVLYSAGSLVTGLLRAFTAVPMHAACSGIMGYFVGRAKLAQSGRGGLIAAGFGVAVFIHGFYDWVVFSGGELGFGAGSPVKGLLYVLVIVAVIMVVQWMLVKDALRRDDELLGTHARPLALATPFGSAPNAPGYGPGMGPSPYGQAPFGAPHGQPGAHGPYAGPPPAGGYGPPAQGGHGPAGWGASPGEGALQAGPPGLPGHGPPGHGPPGHGPPGHGPPGHGPPGHGPAGGWPAGGWPPGGHGGQQ